MILNFLLEVVNLLQSSIVPVPYKKIWRALCVARQYRISVENIKDMIYLENQKVEQRSSHVSPPPRLLTLGESTFRKHIR